MPKGDVQKNLVEKVFKEIQKQYSQERKDEAALLHNQMAAVIGEMQPDGETLLLVLELLKQESLGNLIDKMERVKIQSQEIKPEEVKPEEKVEPEEKEKTKSHSGGAVG